MFSGNMAFVNDYIVFRLLMEDAEKKKQHQTAKRHSLLIPRASISDEPFCSPLVPHVPIRQRLSNSRRCTSVDVHEDAMCVGGYQRRRRMSLLQTLRQQNRQLADSGLDVQRASTRETSTPPAENSPPPSPSSKKTFASIRKIFAKKPKRSTATNNVYANGECSQSCDVIGARSRKSPSTNDSGRGSQGNLDETREPVAVRTAAQAPKTRTNSCPNLTLLSHNVPLRAPIVLSESEECQSPISNACFEFERCVLEKEPTFSAQLKQSRAQMAMSPCRRLMGEDELSETSELDHFSFYTDRSHDTETIADFDDSTSLLLDHFLPLSRTSQVHDDFADEDDESTNSLRLSREDFRKSEETGTSVQTDLSLLKVEDEVAELFRAPEDRNWGRMDQIARHYYEFQSFINLPHKAIQLHKVPPSQAGTDASAGWAPKNMNRAGKNQPSPAARANRVHRDPRPNASKYGRPGKKEHHEWGDRHGELKDEKAAPHKDAWTKFLSNEEPTSRNFFECEFEDRILQTEDETLLERSARSSNDEYDVLPSLPVKKEDARRSELLIILTYAKNVQFVTATVKKARNLPYNSEPFARIMLFDGRRLLEQKQTTVNPSLRHSASIESGSKPSSSVSTSSSSSSRDATFTESFLFHVTPGSLSRSHIVVELFDNSSSGAECIGHVVVGLLGTSAGSAHWLKMVKKHGTPICMWHHVEPT